MAGRIGLISKYNKYEGVYLSIYHWLVIMCFLGAQSCLQEDNVLLKKEKYSELESQTFFLPTHTPTVRLSNSYVNRNIWMQSSQMRSQCAGTKEKSYAAVSHKATQQEVTTKLTRYDSKGSSLHTQLRSLLSNIIGQIYQDYSKWGENTLQLERLNHWC